ncbi:hypothetical protein HMPREF9071_0175 [Capnocytophaga sp. oral taxon 338 str. F0234]|nr:hypothetical protein HMPREF9071_0175 [Capnocytophaga sp. oral taxon 338 str. F0234]
MNKKAAHTLLYFHILFRIISNLIFKIRGYLSLFSLLCYLAS